jgi:tRNA-2-methylthio-N6-dimethylallyladenosine synthase
MSETQMIRKAFIKTYGCQMNVYDSERMADVLAGQGYGTADRWEDADLVVLNTCHIREKAAEKIYSELGRMRREKEKRAATSRPMTLAVAGCVAQAEGEEIVRRTPAVDLVFGPQTFHRLPEILARHEGEGKPVVETAFPADEKFARLAEQTKSAAVTAFLTVQEGCDKFCTFCVVPYTRGSEYSRPVAQVLEEARKLARAGVREVTLLGQNVNAYHGLWPSGEACSLAGLLQSLAKIDGLERLRYTTSHPREMDAALIDEHASNPKLMPYLHLPVQAGSDRILKAMNRGHKAADYLAVIERVRRARPDIALSGDFIVGFPGETDVDFQATLNLVREVGYASAFSFKYSPRPGTPAATRADQVPEPVKSGRLVELQALLKSQSDDFNRSCIGRTMPVLLEKPGRRPGQVNGRSPYLQPVHVTGPVTLTGTIVDVMIDGVGGNSLSAHISGRGLHDSGRIGATRT